MSYTPSHLKPYARPDHYSGQTWEGWYPVLGQTRDSCPLTRSNYRVTLQRLRATAGDRVTPDGEPVATDTRARHFACGWVETIYVWAGDDAVIRAADSIIAALGSYPILDEEDLAELKMEEAQAYWTSYGTRERMEWCERAEVSIFAARRDTVPGDVVYVLTQ